MNLGNERWPDRAPRATLGVMITAKDLLGQALGLPEQERTALANALLNSLEGPNAYDGLSPEEFRAEMIRRADDAIANPDEGEDWHAVRREIAGD